MESFLNIAKCLPWKTNVPNSHIIKVAKNYFKEQKFSCNKLCFRVFGLSGSGKTTQILPALEEFCLKKQINPVKLAVRNFSKLHPNYNTLLKKHGRENIREKTNGFALRVLLCVFVLCVQNGADVILEVALLGKNIEKTFLSLLQKYSYKTKLFCVCANYNLCLKLINKRSKKIGIEQFRNTPQSTTKIFKKMLLPSLNYIAQNANCCIVIWVPNALLPIYFGNTKNCYKIFKKAQKNKSALCYEESKLVLAKQSFLFDNILV